MKFWIFDNSLNNWDRYLLLCDYLKVEPFPNFDDIREDTGKEYSRWQYHHGKLLDENKDIPKNVLGWKEVEDEATKTLRILLEELMDKEGKCRECSDEYDHHPNCPIGRLVS